MDLCFSMLIFCPHKGLTLSSGQDQSHGFWNISRFLCWCKTVCDVTRSAPPQDVQGYKWVRWRVWLCRVAAVLSLGLLLLVFQWRPRLAVLARCCSCPLPLADVLLLKVGHEVVSFFWLCEISGSWRELRHKVLKLIETKTTKKLDIILINIYLTLSNH